MSASLVCSFTQAHANHLQTLLDVSKTKILDLRNRVLELQAKTSSLEEELRVATATDATLQHRQLMKSLRYIQGLIQQLAGDEHKNQIRDIVREELQRARDNNVHPNLSAAEIQDLIQQVDAVETGLRNMFDEITAGIQNATAANPTQRLREPVRQVEDRLDRGFNRLISQVKTSFKQCMLAIKEARSGTPNRANNPQVSTGSNSAAPQPSTSATARMANRESENEANSLGGAESETSSPPPEARPSESRQVGSGTKQNLVTPQQAKRQGQASNSSSKPIRSRKTSLQKIRKPVSATSQKAKRQAEQRSNWSSMPYALRSRMTSTEKKRKPTPKKAERQGQTSSSSSMPYALRSRKTSSPPEKTRLRSTANDKRRPGTGRSRIASSSTYSMCLRSSNTRC